MARDTPDEYEVGEGGAVATFGLACERFFTDSDSDARVVLENFESIYLATCSIQRQYRFKMNSVLKCREWSRRCRVRPIDSLKTTRTKYESIRNTRMDNCRWGQAACSEKEGEHCVLYAEDDGDLDARRPPSVVLTLWPARARSRHGRDWTQVLSRRCGLGTLRRMKSPLEETRGRSACEMPRIESMARRRR